MKSTANFLGSTLGVVIVVSATGWFGYHHYKDTLDERLPLKMKQALVNFQKQLPIELSPGLTIERFYLKRNSVDVVLRTNHPVDRRLSKDQRTLRTHFAMCKWRDQFVKQVPVTLRFTLMGPDGTELTSVENTLEICSRLPSTLPIQRTM